MVALACFIVCLSPSGWCFERFGIVLLHGKTGMPSQFTLLAADLADLGYLIETPEMCWSARRIFDRSFSGCLQDVDAAVARLKADGAEGIIVAGHSLGGVGALLYGATHDGLAGIIALAPDGDPVRFGRIPVIAKSVAAASAAVKAGKGEIVSTFNDFVLGKSLPVKAKAVDFLTFYGADSPAVMTKTIPKLTAPLLWVAGTKDSSQRNAETLFKKAPKQPENTFVKVNAGHLGTPGAAFDPILDWLETLDSEAG